MTQASNTKISKKSIAAQIYANLIAQGKTRKEILFGMCEGADLTQPGASTYYNNLSKGLWTVPPAEVVGEVDVVDEVVTPTIDLESMTNAQLVELYNNHAIVPVKKFRDHATAVRRTREAMTAE